MLFSLSQSKLYSFMYCTDDLHRIYTITVKFYQSNTARVVICTKKNMNIQERGIREKNK